MDWSDQGRIAVPGGEVAYGIVGEGERTLLTLHGGPGATSWYCYSMADLARDGLRVVFYDQLGCGHSDQPDDPSLWRVERFVEEAEAVRRALDLGEVDLWGQSWGGMLAQEYALAHPGAIRTLGLASTICSGPFQRAELARLAAGFGEPTASLLAAALAGGEPSGDAYDAAITEFYARHVCRIPYPPDVERAFANVSQAVYGTMWGPDELAFTGTLSTWDVTDRIGAIDAPTLITVGRHDELTPASAQMIAERIAGSDLQIFERSGHLAHVEEQERYMRVVRDFLDRH
jgi:proline iminopeptidase